jgi:DNA replication protein DnaC
MTDVAALISRLESSRTITPRFKWNLTANDASLLLEAAYKVQVTQRGRIYEDDHGIKMCLQQLAEWCVNPGYKTGAALCGTFGDGKTNTLYALQQATNTLIDAGLCHKDMGIQIVDACDLLQIAKDYKAYKAKREYPVLAIDDIGREPVEIMEYGNRLSPIIDLLEFRYAYRLPTFITTNLSPEEFGPKYDERIASRFRETMIHIAYPQKSYRK